MGLDQRQDIWHGTKENSSGTLVGFKAVLTFLTASSKFSSSSGTPFSFLRTPEETRHKNQSQIRLSYTARSWNLQETEIQRSTDTFPNYLSERLFLLVILRCLTVVLRGHKAQNFYCTETLTKHSGINISEGVFVRQIPHRKCTVPH